MHAAISIEYHQSLVNLGSNLRAVILYSYSEIHLYYFKFVKPNEEPEALSFFCKEYVSFRHGIKSAKLFL